MSLRLLIDENFPAEAVESIRQLGGDVVWVREAAPGLSDQEILAWGRREERVVVTLDKDFGELAFRSKLPSESGVVLFRVLPIPNRLARLAVGLFTERPVLSGRFVVVEEGRVRERPLPGSEA